MQVIILKQNKVFIKISTKYSHFFDVFLEKKGLVLLKQTKFNKHIIKLENNKQPFY